MSERETHARHHTAETGRSVTPATQPADIDERARLLHRESLVIDALASSNPKFYSPTMMSRIDELLRSNAPYSTYAREIELLSDKALVSGQLKEYWDVDRASGVDVGSVTVMGTVPSDPWTYEGAMRSLARWTQKFDIFRDRLLKVMSADDAEKAHRDGLHGIILNLQNTTHFGDSLQVLDQFYEFGVRVIQLTYNSRNLVGDGCTERNPAGLSHFGVNVVKRLNDLGVVVDVSHCSEPTALDAVGVSTQPIALTHTFARAISDQDRGKSDAVLRAVGADGFIGILLVPYFLTRDPHPTLAHFLRHVDHIVSLVGADHVGVGTDYGPVPTALAARRQAEYMTEGMGFRPEHKMDLTARMDGYRSWADWPNLTAALLRHGFSEGEVKGFIGGNFLRLFRRVVG